MKTTMERKTIWIYMRKAMAEELEARARSMYLDTSKYTELVLSDWLASGQQLELAEQ